MDRFTDDVHSLLQFCRSAEQMKSQVSTINNRYQGLHTASKELVTKWELIVDDHQAFDRKLQECLSSLDSIRSSLNTVSEDSDVERRIQKFQVRIFHFLMFVFFGLCSQ